MSSKVKSALTTRPQKPLNGYFKLRKQKFLEYDKKGEVEGKNAKFAYYWSLVSEKEREKLNDAAADEMEKYRKTYAKWLEKNDLTEEEVKKYLKKNDERSKSTSKSQDKKAKRSKSKRSASKGGKRQSSKSKSKDTKSKEKADKDKKEKSRTRK